MKPHPLRARIGDLLQSGISRLQWRISRHEVMHNIPTGVPWTDPDRTTAIMKLRSAMDLIATTQPRRLTRLKVDVKRILVTSVQVADAQFAAPSRTVVLDDTYVCKPEVTPSHVATTIVHEAVHARLFTVGIGYPQAFAHELSAFACARN